MLYKIPYRKDKKMITKKHLKELADIVYMAQSQAQQRVDQELSTHLVTQEIKSFAKRHAPNFDESRWNDYMHKLRQRDQK